MDVKVGVGVFTAVDVGVGLLFTDMAKFVLHVPVEFIYTTVAFISKFIVYPATNCEEVTPETIRPVILSEILKGPVPEPTLLIFIIIVFVNYFYFMLMGLVWVL